MIATRALTKRYGRVTAVDAMDLEVRAGDRYGLLGPNGSGKTTLVRLLLGLVYATSGEISVLDQPVPARLSAILPQVGALVEAPAAYGHLSGRANLGLLDAAGPGPSGGPGPRRTRRARIEEALERVGLSGIDRRPVKAYSLGMRQRLGLAAALLRQPRLLVLDEPTNGLDPQGIREIRDLLLELNAAGTTLFLSSHLLTEVEQVCTDVLILNHGKVAALGPVAAVVSRAAAPRSARLRTGPDRVEEAVTLLAAVHAVSAARAADGRPGEVTIELSAELAAPAAAAAVLATLVEAGVPVAEFTLEGGRLSDAFLEVVST